MQPESLNQKGVRNKMPKNPRFLIALLVLLVSGTGCSTLGSGDGNYQNRKNECNKHSSNRDYIDCMERAGKGTKIA